MGLEPLADPAALHPALWRPGQMGRASAAVQPSGFTALDALLPGGGWPHAALTELLLPHPGVGEMRLLAPALAASPGVMLFGPPAWPCVPALRQLGLDPSGWLLVCAGDAAAAEKRRRDSRPSEALLWALEQALRSGHEAAVIAWLPARLKPDVLRRLQLAAQGHGGPAFVLRAAAAAASPSPAPLRLALQPGQGPQELLLHLLKRRGPALEAPLRLRLPGLVAGALNGHSDAEAALQHAAVGSPQPAPVALASDASGCGLAPDERPVPAAAA